MKNILKKLKKLPVFVGSARDMLRKEDGVAAVEFALLAPLLVLLFLGTVETSYAVSVDRKLSRTASSIADLVTQSQSFDAVPTRQFMTIASKIMAPYDHVPCIVISSIYIENGQALVKKSFDNSSGVSNANKPTTTCTNSADPLKIARRSRTINTAYPVPASIKIDKTWLVAAEVEMDHSPIVGFFGFSKGALTNDTSAIILSDQILLRPRLGGDFD